MLRDACYKRGRDFEGFSEIAGVGGTGTSCNKGINSKLVEANDQLPSEDAILNTVCNERNFRSTEQRISNRYDNNRRTHLPLGRKPSRNREFWRRSQYFMISLMCKLAGASNISMMNTNRNDR